MSRIKIILKHWLPLAALCVALCGLVYVSIQQVLRQDANDPQIQLAQDAAARLAEGAAPESVLPAGPVDPGRSLAPFVIVYDAQGAVLASSAERNGQTPALPLGVLYSARDSGENRVTWQPEPLVRVAAVVVPVAGARGGFVLAGRSLLEVEKREQQMLLFAGMALAATLAATLVLAALGEILVPAAG